MYVLSFSPHQKWIDNWSNIYNSFPQCVICILYSKLCNSDDNRSDAIVSGAVFVGLAGSMAGYPVLDPIAGVLVSGLIAQQVSQLAD
jgi:hypothetical protein